MLVTVAGRKVMGTLNDGAGGTSGAALRQTARRCINQICLAYAHTLRQPYYRFLTTPPQQQAADWKVSKKRGEKSTHAGSSGGCVWPGFEGSSLAAINVEHFLGASCVFFKRLRHLTARKQKKVAWKAAVSTVLDLCCCSCWWCCRTKAQPATRLIFNAPFQVIHLSGSLPQWTTASAKAVPGQSNSKNCNHST